MNEKEKIDLFYNGGLVEYMSEEQLGCVIAYIYKNFSYVENSSAQLNNCVNLVNFLKRHELTIGEVEADKLLDRSPKLTTMFRVLDNADVLIRVGNYPELKELFDLYCLRNDVILGRDADIGFLENKWGKKDIDLLKLYLDEIGKYELLTADEEKDLFLRYMNGDESARLKLVEHNLRLVVSIAKRYKNQFVSLDDLIQFGNEGLMVASRKFDINKGYRFSTYATHWIRQAVTRGIADHSRTIRIPVHLHECMSKVRRVTNEYITTYGENPSEEKLSELTGYSLETIRRAIECNDLTVSLSVTINEDEDTTLADIIEDENSSLENIGQVNDKVTLETIFELAGLGERDEYIIKARNGFYGKIYTLQEVGDKLHLTRERVRQLELKALEKLRKASKRSNFSRLCQIRLEEKNNNDNFALARMC